MAMDTHSQPESEAEKRLIEAARREAAGAGGLESSEPAPDSDAPGPPPLPRPTEAGPPESDSEPAAGCDPNTTASGLPSEPSTGPDLSSYLRPEESTGPAANSIPGYSILREIHRGGQGVVYQAIQKTTRRKVAIKVMREGPFASKHEQARFEREVQVLAALKHPNIVAIHESGTAAGSFYFVMDYISGQPLDVYMAAARPGSPKSGRRSVRETLALFQKICEAVNAAHLRGVIHRDLKPSNIRIDPEGEPQVLDFGLAKVAPGQIGDESVSMTQTGQFVGSLPWASPEQAEGMPSKIDIRTDVYSLGVILHQMLTGKCPYDVVGGFREVLDRIMTAPPIRPRTLRKDIDDEVETIVLKCLSKDRERRYQSAGELARDIGHYLAGEPIEAKRDSTWYVVGKHLRHYKAPIAAGALFVFLLAGFAISMSIQAQQNRRLAQEADRDRRAAENSANEARKQSYYAFIGAAGAAIADNNFNRAMEVLLDCPDPYRNWEWGWLMLRCNLDVMTLRGHTDRVAAVAFIPDSRYLATAGRDGTAKLWDVRSGEDVRTFKGHTKGLNDLAFDPAGRRLATASDDQTVRVWDVESGAPLLTIADLTERVGGVAFSPDGTRLAAAIGSPGRSHDPCVRVWDALSGKELRVLPRYAGAVLSIAFSPDGRYLAAGSEGKAVRVWNAQTGDTIWTRGDVAARSVCFSPDSRILATNGGRTASLWDSSTGREIRRLLSSVGNDSFISFSPRGDQVVTAGEDRFVRLWDTETGTKLLELGGHSGSVGSGAFSPDGRWLASASADKTVRLWSIETNKYGGVPIKAYARKLFGAGFSPDGSVLATIGVDYKVDLIRFWDAQKCQEIETGMTEAASSIAFSPDGRLVAIVRTCDRAVQLWDWPSRRWVLTIRAPGANKVDFSPRDQHLAVACESGVSTYGTDTGEHVLTLDASLASVKSGVAGMAYSPDGSCLAVDPYGSVILCDTRTGKRLHEFTGLDGAAFAFSPDGKLLVTSLSQGVCGVWDVATFTLIRRLEGHGHVISSLAFSPDGTRLLTAGLDRTTKVWDVASWRELTSLQSESSSAGGVAFSPDGSTIVTADYNGWLFLWRTFPWKRADYARTGAPDWEQQLERYKRDHWKRSLVPADRQSRLATATRPYRGDQLFSTSVRYQETAANWRRTLADAETLAARDPKNAKSLEALADLYSEAAEAVKTGDKLHYFNLKRKEVSTIERLAELDRENNWYVRGQDLCWVVGQLAVELGLEPVEEYFLKRVQLAERLVALEPKQPGHKKLLADTLLETGQRLKEKGKLAEAKACFLKGAERLEPLVEKEPQAKGYRLRLRHFYILLAAIAREGGDADGAAAQSAKASALVKALGSAELSKPKELKAAASVYDEFAKRYLETEDSAGADFCARQGVAIAEKLASVEPRSLDTYRTLYQAYGELADVLTRLERAAEARQFKAKAIAVSRQMVEHQDATTNDLNSLAWHLATCSDKELRDPATAVILAQRGVEKTEGKNAAILNTLGVAQYQAGRYSEAIDTLARSDTAQRGIPADVAFIALAHWRLGEHDKAQASFDRLRRIMSSGRFTDPDSQFSVNEVISQLAQAAEELPNDAKARAYWGVSLWASGKPAEGAQKLRQSIELDAGNPWAHFMLAELLVQQEKSIEAAGEYLRAIELAPEQYPEPDSLPRILNALSACGRGAEVEALADRLARRQPHGSRSPGVDALAQASREYEADLRWLKECLAKDGVVRINCGGGDFTDSAGNRWGRDRFYQGGLAAVPFKGEIAATNEDPLYHSERYFPPHHRGLCGYRLPVPTGRYRVVLHFAEVVCHSRQQRIFDIEIEGRTVLMDYEPLAAGFATAEQKVFTTTVQDGLLDIGFICQVRFDDAKISALEAHRLTE
jgi:eukaryotic-like serine/threonine-protein kinase